MTLDKFQLRYDFALNEKPLYFDKEDKKTYEFISSDLSGFEMMCVIKEFYQSRNVKKRAFAERLIKLVSVCIGKSREEIISGLQDYSMR
jgi:hypothetical protein